MKSATMLALSLLVLAAAGAPPPGFGGPPQALNLQRFRNKRILIVTAHPDDAEYYAGGTVARMRAQNLNVTVAYLVVTSGNAGGRCYDTLTGEYRNASYTCESEELAFLRRREMLAAGRVLGVQHVWRCGFGDGMLVSVQEAAVRERIAAFARRFRPFAVFSHYPYPNFMAPQTCNGQCADKSEQRMWGDSGYHPDHKRVGWHALNTFYGGGSASDNAHLFPELDAAGGLRAWKPAELYFFALTANQPMTHFVPLGEETIQRKAQALGAHRSQYSGPPEENVRWVGKQVAKGVGKGAGVACAEGFQAFF